MAIVEKFRNNRRILKCFICGKFGHEGDDCGKNKEDFKIQRKGKRNMSIEQASISSRIKYLDMKRKEEEKSVRCVECGRLGHMALYCPQNGYNSDREKFCFVLKEVSCLRRKMVKDLGNGSSISEEERKNKCLGCGKFGHYTKNCPKYESSSDE